MFRQMCDPTACLDAFGQHDPTCTLPNCTGQTPNWVDDPTTAGTETSLQLGAVTFFGDPLGARFLHFDEMANSRGITEDLTP